MANEDSLYTHPACLVEEALLRLCKIEHGRSRGPGGQHRNKVQTMVTVTHIQAGISGTAGERRSQGENRKIAIMRLRVNLALALRGNGVQSPSLLWKSRAKKGKILCNAKHWDFPAMLAECLDVLKDCDYDLAGAGQVLGVSGSQIVKFLKSQNKAMEILNQRREALGLGKLR